MLPQYWVLIIYQDVEAGLQGPYATAEARDAAAIAYRKADNVEFPDGLHTLDIDASGIPTVGDYSGGAFDEDEEA